MSTQKSLSLSDRLEPSHHPLSNPGRLMGLLCPIILILFSAMNNIRHQLSMRNTITTQFIGHNLPRFTTIASQ